MVLGDWFLVVGYWFLVTGEGGSVWSLLYQQPITNNQQPP
jgi:hypothetical protein